MDSIADSGPRDPSSNPTHPFLLFFSQNFQILWSLALYGGKLQIFYFLKRSFSHEMISSSRPLIVTALKERPHREGSIAAASNNDFTEYPIHVLLRFQDLKSIKVYGRVVLGFRDSCESHSIRSQSRNFKVWVL